MLGRDWLRVWHSNRELQSEESWISLLAERMHAAPEVGVEIDEAKTSNVTRRQ